MNAAGDAEGLRTRREIRRLNPHAPARHSCSPALAVGARKPGPWMKLQLGRSRGIAKRGMARKTPARVPDGLALYAIGDVHGRADLLAPLLDALLEDAAG